jgi:hypothetical protein
MEGLSGRAQKWAGITLICTPKRAFVQSKVDAIKILLNRHFSRFWRPAGTAKIRAPAAALGRVSGGSVSRQKLGRQKPPPAPQSDRPIGRARPCYARWAVSFGALRLAILSRRQHISVARLVVGRGLLKTVPSGRPKFHAIQILAQLFQRFDQIVNDPFFGRFRHHNRASIQLSISSPVWSNGFPPTSSVSIDW